MSKIKVLFFAADPLSVQGEADKLLLDEEVRRIRRKVRGAEHRDCVDLDLRPAASGDDLLQALNEVRPQIVHFSGHGGRNGLVLSSEDGTGARTANAAVLKRMFKLFRGDIRVGLLNACTSLPQAEAIADVVGCAIGMRSPISDLAAITFSASFYRAIAFGTSVQDAYEQACLAVAMEHPDEEECAVLVARPDVNPAELVLVSPGVVVEPAPAAAHSTPAKGFRRLGAIAAVAVAVVFGSFLLYGYKWGRDPNGGAQGNRASINTLFHPESTHGIDSPTPIVPGDLTKAKDLYDARSYAVAFSLFRNFAEDGNEEAMGYLGVMYLNGEGTDPNKALAEHWLEKALEKERDPRVMHGRGLLHEMNGKYYWAKHWYDAAIEEHGYAPAMSSLAGLYAHGRYVKANRDSAIALYKKAADAGFVDALVGAGEVYQRGLDGPRNTDAALNLYNQAANKGSARAMEMIGRMYEQGDGVARNPQQARHWYQKAADAGSAVAAANLALLNAR